MGDGAPIIGIDLGTTNSVVAIAKDGEVRVIPDENGNRIQSSIVAFFDDGSVVVGNEARREAVVDPIHTVYSAKRLIGRDFNAEATRQALQHLPYTVVGGDSGAPMIEIYGELFGLPEISGMVLRRMKDIAERSLGESLSKAVITVPANFNDTQRQMTKLAGTLAGLDVVRVLNEPTAAALAYGYGKGIDARIAIYDFGGGTFDITILDISGSIFEVISTAGDTFLGGDDLDYRMVNYMLRIFQRQHNMSIEDDPIAVSRLKQVAEKLKIELSEKERAVVTIHELAVDRKKKPLGLKFQVNREAFSLRCEDIIQRTFLVCDEALRGAGIKAAEIDAVVLVGGSTRMPVVREMVAAYFGRTPLTDINPEEVVAIGAAIQANSLHINPFEPGAKPQPLLLDVTPMSLGLQTVAGFYDILIRRNTCIPCEQRRVFTTTTDGQTSVRVQIFQGESRSTVENIKLGEVELYGLRAAPRGDVQIEVTFEIDTDGIVVVTARDQETGMEQATRISVHAGYSDNDLSAMMNRGD